MSILPSGLLIYTTPENTADELVGGKFYSAYIGSESIYANIEHPETDKKIEGFKWDNACWMSDDTIDRYGEIRAIFDPSISGLKETYFQSGIGDDDDIQLINIDTVTTSGLRIDDLTNDFVPEINHGYYYDYSEGRYLFSDGSNVIYPTCSGLVDGISQAFNKIGFPDYPKTGIPIKARKFIWDSSIGKYELEKEYIKKDHFTGLRDADLVRQETDDEYDRIFWHLIDTTYEEFIVTYSGNGFPNAIFNTQIVEEIGSITQSGIPALKTQDYDYSAEDFNLDFLGYTTGLTDEVFNTTFSPIDLSMEYKVFTWNSVNDIQEWLVVTSGLTLTGNQCYLDRDLGLVQFGGDTIPTTGSKVGAYYWNTAQIEYEPENTIDSVKGYEVSLNPIIRSSGRGFLYLGTYEDSPASITLEADLPEISTDTYGPLYIGNTYAKLIATVLDQQGNYIEGLPVIFHITSTPISGSFSNQDSINAMTGVNGKAKTFYNPPESIAELGEYTTSGEVNNSPSYPAPITQTTSLFIDELALAIDDFEDPAGIYLYQVHANDALLGILYSGIDFNSEEETIRNYYVNYFSSEESIYGRLGLTSSGTVEDYTITWEEAHRELLNLSQPIWFSLNSESSSGRKLIVAEYDTTAVNPHVPDPTTQSGAFIPVEPIEVIDHNGSYELVYDTSSLDFPLPSGLMTAYFIAAPAYVTFQASIYNEQLNKTIYSNEISIKLDIPPYMNGTWLIDGINSMKIEEINSLITSAFEGRIMPLGFRLRSSTVTLAAAVNGVTYLDINHSTNYNVPGLQYRFNVI